MSPELELFVQQEVASGRFSDRESYISHVVRMMKLDQDEAIAGIEAGFEAAAEGRGKPLAEAFDNIRRSVNLTDAK